MSSGQNPPASPSGGIPAPLGVLAGLVLLLALGFLAAHIVSLETQQRATVDELKAIRQALEAGGARPSQPQQGQVQAPPPVDLSKVSLTVNDAATKGKSDAKLTLVEFSDFECPFCGRYVRETYDQLQRDYVQTGKVRYVFRNFPLERIHPHALRAGIAGECARQQGKFWEMHDKLFANQQALEASDLVKTAGAAGLDVSAYQRCAAGPGVEKIRRDLDEGARAGVTGTPYFFVGVTQADGKVKVLRAISGAQPYAAFKSALDQLLSSAAS